MQPARIVIPLAALIGVAAWVHSLFTCRSHETPAPARTVLRPPAGPSLRSTATPQTAAADEAAAESPGPEAETSWAVLLRELKELAVSAPELALERVRTLDDKDERKSAAARVCVVISERDPRRAALAAWELGLGQFSDDAGEDAALETVVGRWADADPAEAFLWANSLPADEEARRDRVFKAIACAVARITPDTAARIVAGDMDPDTHVQADAVVEVLRQWARKDYSGALAWAALFPEGPIRDRGLDELAAAADPGPRPLSEPISNAR